MFFKQHSHVILLLSTSVQTTQIRWVSANIGLAAFILEINLALVQRRVEQVIAVKLDAGLACGRADGEPVQSQGIAASNPICFLQREEERESFALPHIKLVALIFRDDQREAGNLCREGL